MPALEPFADGTAATLLTTALALGIRHGIDWDHIAAIADITSTTAGTEAAEEAHAREHERPGGHEHAHGGEDEHRAHASAPAHSAPRGRWPRADIAAEQRRAIYLGTLYALGHALVVAALGFIAIRFGALLPDWIDPLMGRVVGLTLVLLGVWVFVSLYNYVRHGSAFRLRSRWMLVFDGVRYGWRRFQAALHGHEHVRPLEMSAYGPRTAFGVGVIHGIGAETGTQVLLIAALGGAAGLGLGVPMMLAFIVGLLISNTAIVVLTSLGFVSSQVRTQLYLAAGVIAGAFSLAVGLLFLFQAESSLPSLDQALPF